MVDTREDRFSIRMVDCQPDGRVKASALMQYMQEAAACHAEQLGLGFHELEQRDCLWVLVNLRMEVTHTPRWGEGVIVTTWPSGHTRAIASREFIGRSPDGCEYFRAASDWMILDRQSSRPRNLDKLNFDLPQGGPKVLAVAPRRLQPAEGYAKACRLRVPFSALDFNGHVNNTEYVRWAVDAVHQQLGSLPEIRTMQITYLAEVFEGDEVEMLVAVREGDIDVCARRLKDGADVNAFVMELECRKE
ncbi:MAG: acyl-[acyl-carrier-protein] thioesterase [Solirubrobacterales bacterium]